MKLPFTYLLALALVNMSRTMHSRFLDPSTITTDLKNCTTRTGKPGRCVPESSCNEYLEFISNGVIDHSELRTFRECSKDEWCCSDKTTTKVDVPEPDTTVTDQEGCKVTDRPDCPWCVKLYRSGDDIYRLNTGFFCMGAMIGSKMVLTTGTCVLQARGNMWAQVPNSNNPTSKYKVASSLVHPNYNSGTRANDLALLTLETEVAWGINGPHGACVGINTALSGDECMGAGIDGDENIYMKALQVEKGLCAGLGGSDIDVSCGSSLDDDCPLYAGSPIMCRVNGNFILTGLAKTACINSRTRQPEALLGNLNVASGWLTTNLKETMNEKDFLHQTM